MSQTAEEKREAKRERDRKYRARKHAEKAKREIESAERTTDPAPARVPERPRQGFLEGQEPTTIPAVHAAIEEYVRCRDNRMAWLQDEIEAKQKLAAAMRKAGIDSYNVDGHEAVIEQSENVKAKLVAPDTKPKGD